MTVFAQYLRRSPRGCFLCPHSSRERETRLNHQVPRLQPRPAGLVSHDHILVVFGAHVPAGPTVRPANKRDHLGAASSLTIYTCNHAAHTQAPRLGLEASDIFGSRACLFARFLCHGRHPPAVPRGQIGLEAEAQRPEEPRRAGLAAARPNQQTRLHITHIYHPLRSHTCSGPQGGLKEGSRRGWPDEHPCCSPVDMTARPWLIDPRGVARQLEPATTKHISLMLPHPFSLIIS